MEVGLEVNTEMSKHIAVSRYQDMGQIHNLLFANKSLVNEAKFKYLGTTVTYQNCIQAKCLLPFYSESLVFPFPLQEHKD